MTRPLSPVLLKPERAREAVHGLVLIGMALLLGGCLSRPALSKQTFAFPLLPVHSTSAKSAGGVLEIRDITVAAPYDSTSFIYRTGTYSYERDPYAEFLVPPEESFLGPVRDYLRESGWFSDVVTRENTAKPDVIADISILELYGDFRNRAEPAAVLRMSVAFYRAGEASPRTKELQKQYQQRVPLKARTAAALMAGWDQALKRNMASVIADLKASGKH